MAKKLIPYHLQLFEPGRLSHKISQSSCNVIKRFLWEARPRGEKARHHNLNHCNTRTRGTQNFTRHPMNDICLNQIGARLGWLKDDVVTLG